jgi:protein-L-isoaspartate O-methyltransferase
VLDVGAGVVCQACDDQSVVTFERNRHLTDATAARLADLGFRPKVVCGWGEQDLPDLEFDRIFVSYTVERVPAALVKQLAPKGRLLAHVTRASPSWPALAVVERTTDGQIKAELRASVRYCGPHRAWRRSRRAGRGPYGWLITEAVDWLLQSGLAGGHTARQTRLRGLIPTPVRQLY